MYRAALVLVMLLPLLLVKPSQGQDPEFSQFYANPLYLNPALAGANICPRMILNYRNQWPSLSKGYVTYNASFDMYMEKLHGGLGFIVNSDNAGDGLLTTTTASLMYAYRLKATKKLDINMAVQASFFQRALGWSKLQFEDQIDDQLGFVNPTSEQPPDNQSVMFPDFAAGLAFTYGNNFYGGVAAHHLSEPNMAFYNSSENTLPMKLTGHVGYSVPLSGGGDFGGDNTPSTSISFNALYQQQGQFHQVNAGVYLSKYPLVVGGWFRHNFENPDAFIALVGLQWEGLKIGYSYDLTMSQLKATSGGAHEVSFAWQFGCIEKRRKIRAIKCPQF